MTREPVHGPDYNEQQAGLPEVRETTLARLMADLGDLSAMPARILEVFFTHSLGPLAVLDREFNFLWVNEAYAKAGQREVREYLGRNHFELYPSEAQAIFEEIVRTKVPYKATARPFTFPDHPEWGTTYWDWTLVPVLNDAGEVAFLILSLQDVTRHKLAELSTGATNRLLRLFVEATSRKAYLDAVVLLLCEVTGCRCVGVRMRTPDNFVPYEATVGFSNEFLETECWLQLDRDHCVCTRVIAGQPNPEDAPGLTSAGSFCCNDTLRFSRELGEEGMKAFRAVCVHSGFASLAVIPIRHQDTILGAIHLADERPGVFSPPIVEFLESIAPLIGDVVHRFGIEAALRESSEQLQALNRALEWRAAQLRSMASELTLAEQRERRRLAQLLHDHLQQLLVAAKIRLGILRRRGDPAELDQRLAQIDELLDESIRASRSLTVDLSPPILYDAGLRAALEWLARSVREKHGLHIEFAAEGELPRVSEDVQILLFQAVRELLFNVVKHAGVEQARLTMRVPPGWVKVVVEDAGVGFDPASLDSPESSLDGLGLFSIRERLEALGGSLRVYSRPGHGTRAEISVPFRDREAQAPIDVSRQHAKGATEKTTPMTRPLADNSPKIRVLLADDHKILRQGLAGLLVEEPDVEVVGEAGDGLEAVELAQQIHPDVVLMDVTMPRLDGIAATSRITAALPDVRVIGLSMHEEEDLAAAMREAGAVAYLSKGGSSDLLVATIRNVMRGKRKNDAP